MAIDSKRLLAEVRENLSRLNDCGDHDFAVIPPGPGQHPTLGRKWKCIRCEGVIDGIAHHWYVRGRAHEHASPSKSPLGTPS